VKVVIAPDGFGGTLSARAAADAIAAGWRDARPDDEVTCVPLSDGGEGLVDVLVGDDDEVVTAEVAGPVGRPVEASWLLRADGSAVIESAQACGLALVPEGERDPLRATTFGVGELLEAARDAGVRRILLGLGGSATVDGGTGALLGLGFKLTVDDGSGLKVGAEDLERVARAEAGWSGDWSGIEVVLLADVATRLADAAATFGPQKGATDEVVARLARGLEAWAAVAERDLAGGRPLRRKPGSGAAGGLGFGLACGIGARFDEGSRIVAELQDLAVTVLGADLVVTGEGRLDATSTQGKVVGRVVAQATAAGVQVAGVVGSVGDGAPELADVEAAAPDGPGDDPAGEVRTAAAHLASRIEL
jgi:glycerate 2-kinase